ncbi:hypothetical protein AMATHDRAFT_57055 [Amanita thiersii Skay4041]|uniref:Uncharacterized protein n=1 Tax=Amanita thiersii Skay4041 TaxID=703135 RepID=A0A2A9NPH4_9AGAR|nr:hypothetical protein AMATHDRAFT_57055 [Amanita thiersii Skay4041]
MQPEANPSFLPQLCQRFQQLVWSCLDSDLTKTAVFHAERYFAMDQRNHDARHLYAMALFREGQTHSALCLVNVASDVQCTGCLEIKAKCCTALGRHRQAREALQEVLKRKDYTPEGSLSTRSANPFPDEAALRCRSGSMALKGNLPEQATLNFRQALSLNPYLWEAFEGLCAAGCIGDIDEVFPPRPEPVKRFPTEEHQTKPLETTTNAVPFTPDVGHPGNLFQGHPAPQAQRIGINRELVSTGDPFAVDNLYHRPRQKLAGPIASQIPQQPVRPLSSADETGPLPKRLRSTTRRLEVTKQTKGTKVQTNDPSKKARARPALIFANIFSSSGRRSQPVTTARTAPSAGKNNAPPPANNLATRRSTRLLSTTTTKQSHVTKYDKNSNITRDRRRQISQPLRNHTAESDLDEEAAMQVGLVPSTSPPPVAPSPIPELSPSPSTWNLAQEQEAQDDYDNEMAEYYLYDLIKRFARATRALAMYDCQKCLQELEQLPHVHQKSPWVLTMVGRAHYEKLDYTAAERAFKAVRRFEPYRLWDMEIYSTLLWHLQQNVELSFLAQELLNINPRSPQAWIAVGNLFSLQKERSQALTCFRRAAQLDPSCAYAYTLSGHESIDEDLDKAITFFQSALRVDPQHYNAWYGLGTCYLRMSKIRLAEYHYRKAVEIHPNNAVLWGCVGMAVERRGDKDNALKLFNKAVRLSPENALVRYRRAKILVSMKHFEPAIKDLEYLRSTSPEESNVIFQLAKVYRQLGDEVKSAQMLAVARDISPKSLNKMKKLLATMREEGDDENMEEG